MITELDCRYLERMALKNFTKLGQHKYSFRCPICGDSKKDPTKKRGYASKQKVKGGLVVMCHNCGGVWSYSYFLKIVDPLMFESYRKEVIEYKFQTGKKKHASEVKQEISKNILIPTLKKELILSEWLEPLNEKCIDYLKGRNIEESKWSSFYYSKNFKKFINAYYIPNKFSNEDECDEGIVTVIKNKDEHIIGFQVRFLNSNDKRFRHLTIKIDEKEELYFGFDSVSNFDTIVLTEGIFDALSVEGGCAMMRTTFKDEYLKESFPNKKFIVVLDNEPKNPEVVNAYKKVVEMSSNFGLFFWPNSLKGKVKDLNELKVKSKSDSSNMLKFVKSNAKFDKLQKQFNFMLWSK